MGILAGKVILVVGSASGIGRSVVTNYVAEGARVVAADISPAVEELAAELGDAVVPAVGDARSHEFNDAAVARALDTWGRLDVFVGNAGIVDRGLLIDSVDGAVLATAFTELFGVNVLGPLQGCRAAIPALTESHGAIILTGSFASFHPSGGGTLYTASKHAVLGLVRGLAYELAPDVRVNGVAPGVAPTRLKGIGSLGQEATDSVLDGTELVLPTQQVPTVEDFNGIFTLLASDQASQMTGSMVEIDSGLAIRGIARPGGRVRPKTVG